jgi:hypothetical protein
MTTLRIKRGNVLSARGLPDIVLSTPPVEDVVYAGALPLGTTAYAIPSTNIVYLSKTGNDSNSGTISSPKATLTSAVGAVTSGGTVVVRGGEYNEGYASPSGKAVTIQAYPGEVVWFDGSRVASAWTNNGNGTWTTAYTENFARFAVDGYPGLPFRNYIDQCWVDGVALSQIEDATTPGAGQFSVNQAADTLTIGANPTGKEVRVSDITQFLIASGRVNLLGIGVRRYSPPGVEGLNAMAFYGGTSEDTVIENCWFTDSAMAGLAWSKSRFRVSQNTFQDCGYSGVMVTKSDGMTFNNNLIRRFNLNGWHGQPATGAIKITRSDSFEVYQNYTDTPAYDCPTIWLDVSNTRFKVYNNVTRGGEGMNLELNDGGFYGGVQYTSWIVNNDTKNIHPGCNGNISYWNNRLAGYNLGLNIKQDRGMNTGAGDNRTPEECPWINQNLEVVNNEWGAPDPAGNYKIQFLAYDDQPKYRRGLDMFDRIEGNRFYTTPPGSMAQMGKIDGFRETYNTPAALDAAPAIVGDNSCVGPNRQGSGPLTAADHAGAVPMPAVVAEMMNLPVGTKLVGLNEAALPVPRPDGGYDVIVAMIQSNMRGAATDYTSSDQYPAGVDMWNHATGQIVAATEPQSNWDNFNGMGGSNTFVKDWVANRLEAGRKVLIVNTTRGGTGFTTPSSNSFGTGFHWRNDLAADSNNLAVQARNAIQAAMAAAGPNARLVAFLANHGSTDGTNNTPKATFKTYLQSWITWLRGQLNASDVPYLMMQMRPDLIANETRHKNIADAQAETASELPMVGYALSPVGSTYYKADAVHFNAAGVRQIGHNLYAKYGELKD